MRKIWGIFLAAAVLLSGCKRYDPVETAETPPPMEVQEEFIYLPMWQEMKKKCRK